MRIYFYVWALKFCTIWKFCCNGLSCRLLFIEWSCLTFFEGNFFKLKNSSSTTKFFIRKVCFIFLPFVTLLIVTFLYITYFKHFIWFALVLFHIFKCLLLDVILKKRKNLYLTSRAEKNKHISQVHLFRKKFIGCSRCILSPVYEAVSKLYLIERFFERYHRLSVQTHFFFCSERTILYSVY